MPDIPAAPIRPRQRNQTLDVLRGFAMLGILLINIQLFRGDFWPQFLGESRWTAPVDRAVTFASALVADWKFLSAFSFMFGLGTAVQLERARARGDQSTAILRRRFGILALLGLAHGLLIWPGDVLLLYAVLGMLLLRFRHATTRTLLRWVAGLATVLLVVPATGAALTASQPSPTNPVTADPGVAALAERAMAVYTHGSYLDQVGFRLIEFPLVQFGSLLASPMVFMLMLLGLAAGKAGMVSDPDRFVPLLRRVSRWGLTLGVLLNLVFALSGGTGALGGKGGGLGVVAVGLMYVAPPTLTVGYLATLALACRNPAVLGRLAPLGAVGRMAVSAYLFMSVVCTAFFSVTGLYGSVPPAASMLVVGVVWAMLLVVCPWWLGRFRMGPVEWAWRSLTYRARQPFRVARPEPSVEDPHV